MLREARLSQRQRHLRQTRLRLYVLYGVGAAVALGLVAYFWPQGLVAALSLVAAGVVLLVARSLHPVQEQLLARLSGAELELASEQIERKRQAREHERRIAKLERSFEESLRGLHEQLRAARDALEAAEERRETDLQRVVAALEGARKQLWQNFRAQRERALAGDVAIPPALAARVEEIAQTDAACLVAGEAYDGREALARALHAASARAAMPFLSVDCGNLAVESQLWGGNGPGAFQLADGGTLFLDAIEGLPLGAQQSVVRYLETGELEGTDRRVDVRIVAGSAVDLEQRVRKLEFREDLYERISRHRLRPSPPPHLLDDLEA